MRTEIKTIIFLSIPIVFLGVYNLTHYKSKIRPEGNRGNYYIEIEKVSNITKQIMPIKEINYFETEKNINNWFMRTDNSKDIVIKRSPLNVTQGKYSMQVKWQKAEWVELILVHFPEEWQLFRSLTLDIFNANNGSEEFKIKIGDKFDASGFYSKANKYTFEKSLKPGLNRININIGDIKKQINISADRKVIHLFFFGKDKTFYIDNVKLEA